MPSDVHIHRWIGRTIAERYRLTSLRRFDAAEQLATFRAVDENERSLVFDAAWFDLRDESTVAKRAQRELEIFVQENRRLFTLRDVGSFIDAGEGPTTTCVWTINSDDGSPTIAEVLAAERTGATTLMRALTVGRNFADARFAQADFEVHGADLDVRSLLLRSDDSISVRVTPRRFAARPSLLPPNDVSLLAPEEIIDDLRGNLGGRVDVYRIGALVFLLASGRAPASTLRDAVLRTRPSLSSVRRWGDVTPAIDRVIARCLSLEPSRRPDDVLMVRAQLDALISAAAEG